jgi:hypothetical protein
MSLTAETVLADLERAITAGFALARQLAAGQADPDEWLRFPGAGQRCAISGWSRAKIDRLTRDSKVRRKSVGTSAFYSGADVRRMLTDNQPLRA